MSDELGQDLGHVDEATSEDPVDAHEQSFLIGLTGPIGCGKSTVARMLGELGGMIVDADVLARRATAAGAATLPQIRRRFGEGVFSAGGELNRAALAAIVFRDADALRDLERIVHPQVRLLLEEALQKAARERVPFVVFEAIKLVEGGLAERCDEVWLIDCSPDVQRERLAGRGSDTADLERRLATQGEGLADRLAASVRGLARVRRLSTDGSVEETRERVEDALADALEPLVLGDR